MCINMYIINMYFIFFYVHTQRFDYRHVASFVQKKVLPEINIKIRTKYIAFFMNCAKFKN